MRSRRASWQALANLGLVVALLGVGPRPVAADPNEANELLATAYERKARGDQEGALEAFDEARKAGAPSQRISLELAYVYLSRGDTSSARVELQAATSGPDLVLANQARRQLAQLPTPWWADFYAESFGWHRARGANQSTDVVPTIRMRGLRRLSDGIDAHAYLFAQATRDTSSRGFGAGVPAIYADNRAMAGGGFLLRLAKRSVGLFGQVGPAVSLLDDGHDRFQLDVRGGAFLSLASAACYEQGGIVENGTWCAELYSETIYTSRFNNDIQGFIRQRTSFSYLETGPMSWQLFLELRAAIDKNGDYYDNFVDSGLGPRWRLHRPFPIDFLLGAHVGSYLGRQNVDPLPMTRDYVDFRLFVTTYVELD